MSQCFISFCVDVVLLESESGRFSKILCTGLFVFTFEIKYIKLCIGVCRSFTIYDITLIGFGTSVHRIDALTLFSHVWK